MTVLFATFRLPCHPSTFVNTKTPTSVQNTMEFANTKTSVFPCANQNTAQASAGNVGDFHLFSLYFRRDTFTSVCQVCPLYCHSDQRRDELHLYMKSTRHETRILVKGARPENHSESGVAPRQSLPGTTTRPPPLQFRLFLQKMAKLHENLGVPCISQFRL